MKNPKITGRQREALKHIDHLIAQGETPSLGNIAKAMGCSRGTVQKFMIALRAEGFLETPMLVGDWKVTRAGRKAIESA